MEWVKSKTPEAGVRQQPPAWLVSTLRLVGVVARPRTRPRPRPGGHPRHGRWGRRQPGLGWLAGDTDHSNILSEGGTLMVTTIYMSTLKAELLNVKALPNGPISVFGSDAIYSTHNIFSEATSLSCSTNSYHDNFSLENLAKSWPPFGHNRQVTTILCFMS